MKLKDINTIKTKGEARQYAIDWQNWASESHMFYSEQYKWQTKFETLAKKFDLTEEFKENGII